MKDYLFKDKLGNEITFEDLLRKIYENAEVKQRNLLDTVEYIKPFVTSINDAVIIMPNLIALQEVSVKNDDHLIKMAAIVSRIQTSQAKNKNKAELGEFILSEEDKLMLLAEAKQASDGAPGSSK